MLSTRNRTAVAALASAVLSLRPLIDRLPEPVAVSPGPGALCGPGAAGLPDLLERVAGRLGAPKFELSDGGAQGFGPDIFGAVVSGRLALTALAETLEPLPVDGLAAVDRVVDETAAEDFTASCVTALVHGPDGVPVRAYAAGDPGRPAVVIASACGMPVRLAEPWIRRLAVEHFVLTWETRGLFGDGPHPGGEHAGALAAASSVAAQCGDLFAVMDHFAVAAAHVAGLCGGAVLAVEAAALRPERISSLSLWHGDFEVGDERIKTDHQRNLRALMRLAVQAGDGGANVHAVLCRSIADGAPPDLAHLVLYPYATPELLLRYCLLNGAIMDTDLRPRLPLVSRPALVVTSEDDSTAHPAGSRFVADALANARLLVLPHGDHISLFRDPAGLPDVAARFIAEASDH